MKCFVALAAFLAILAGAQAILNLGAGAKANAGARFSSGGHRFGAGFSGRFRGGVKGHRSGDLLSILNGANNPLGSVLGLVSGQGGGPLQSILGLVNGKGGGPLQSILGLVNGKGGPLSILGRLLNNKSGPLSIVTNLLSGEGSLLNGLGLDGILGILGGGRRSLIHSLLGTVNSVTDLLNVNGLFNGKFLTEGILADILNGDIEAGLNGLVEGLVGKNGILANLTNTLTALLATLGVDPEILDTLLKGSDGLISNLESLAKKLTSGLDDVLDKAVEGDLAGAVGALEETVRKTTHEARELVDNLTDNLEEATDIDLNALDPIASELFDVVDDVVKQLAGVLEQVLRSGLGCIGGDLTSLVSDLLSGTVGGKVKGLNGLLSPIIQIVSGALENVLSLTGGKNGLFVSLANGKKGIVSKLGNIAGKLDVSAVLGSGNLNVDVLVLADAASRFGTGGLKKIFKNIFDFGVKLNLGLCGAELGVSVITKGGGEKLLSFTSNLDILGQIVDLDIGVSDLHDDRPILALLKGLTHAYERFLPRIELGRNKRVLCFIEDEEGASPSAAEREALFEVIGQLRAIGCEVVFVQVGEGSLSLDGVLSSVAGILQSGLCAVLRVADLDSIGGLLDQILQVLLAVLSVVLNIVGDALEDVLCVDILGDIVPGLGGFLKEIVNSVHIGGSSGGKPGLGGGFHGKFGFGQGRRHGGRPGNRFGFGKKFGFE